MVYSAKQLRNPAKFTAKLQTISYNNIDKILPKFWNIFSIKRFTLATDPMLIVLFELI